MSGIRQTSQYLFETRAKGKYINEVHSNSHDDFANRNAKFIIICEDCPSNSQNARAIPRAGLIVNPRGHRLERKLAARIRQQTGVDGSQTHVRVLGRIQVLSGAARHAARHERSAVIAD
jgi:hypothetical protein